MTYRIHPDIKWLPNGTYKIVTIIGEESQDGKIERGSAVSNTHDAS